MFGRILIVFFVVIIHSLIAFQWRQHRRPRIIGDKIPLRAIVPNKRRIQRKIVRYHNYLRTKVVPKAANMLRMKWHKEAAKAAQRWSEKCYVLTHDDATGRYINDYGSCGQNIFIATEKVPWFFAIKTWYLEKDNFTYGSDNNDINIVGHYTQMVWASSHEVGCGLCKCFFNHTGKTFYNYICNYCPIGNRPTDLGRPYRRGRPCAMCRRHCHAQKLCTNSCQAADLWINCKELYKVWPMWLCHSNSAKGKERLRHCKATCNCKNKIHD